MTIKPDQLTAAVQSLVDSAGTSLKLVTGICIIASLGIILHIIQAIYSYFTDGKKKDAPTAVVIKDDRPVSSFREKRVKKEKKSEKSKKNNASRASRRAKTEKLPSKSVTVELSIKGTHDAPETKKKKEDEQYTNVQYMNLNKINYADVVGEGDKVAVERSDSSSAIFAASNSEKAGPVRTSTTSMATAFPPPPTALSTASAAPTQPLHIQVPATCPLTVIATCKDTSSVQTCIPSQTKESDKASPTSDSAKSMLSSLSEKTVQPATEVKTEQKTYGISDLTASTANASLTAAPPTTPRPFHSAVSTAEKSDEKTAIVGPPSTPVHTASALQSVDQKSPGANTAPAVEPAFQTAVVNEVARSPVAVTPPTRPRLPAVITLSPKTTGPVAASPKADTPTQNTAVVAGVVPPATAASPKTPADLSSIARMYELSPSTAAAMAASRVAAPVASPNMAAPVVAVSPVTAPLAPASVTAASPITAPSLNRAAAPPTQAPQPTVAVSPKEDVTKTIPRAMVPYPEAPSDPVPLPTTHTPPKPKPMEEGEDEDAVLTPPKKSA